MERILYEDEYILAVHKPVGLATQTSKIGEKDLLSEVLNYLKRKNGTRELPFAGIINRLDQPVEGIVLFGLDKKTTALLTNALLAGEINKHYLAAVAGKPDLLEASIVDYMIKDAKANVSKICDSTEPGAKKAVLEYKVVKEKGNLALLDIHLITGRFHQIRLQMSSAGYPLLGDRKYAPKEIQEMSSGLFVKSVALCAYKLSFVHPVNKKELCIETEPMGNWINLFE